MIPGSNILNLALKAIARQSVNYYRYNGRTINDAGNYVPAFDDPVILTGSFQPTPRSLYEQRGLEFSKTYYNFFVSSNVIDVSRGNSGDEFVFNGNRFKCESITPWYAIDGWAEILCSLIDGTPS